MGGEARGVQGAHSRAHARAYVRRQQQQQQPRSQLTSSSTAACGSAEGAAKSSVDTLESCAATMCAAGRVPRSQSVGAAWEKKAIKVTTIMAVRHQRGYVSSSSGSGGGGGGAAGEAAPPAAAAWPTAMPRYARKKK